MRIAAADGARLMALPELFSTEYFPQELDERYFDYAETIPGPTTDQLAAVTAELGVYLVAPIFEIDPLTKIFYNAAAVIGPQGVIGRYRKRHIPSIPHGLEKSYFAPGNLGYPVFETPYGRIGTIICYDRHFPECYRHLALAGAEIVFTCANSPTEFSKRNWLPEMQVNATGNGIFIVQTNVVGREGAHTFFGLSAAVDPRGELLDQLTEEDEGVLTVEIDLDKIRRARLHYGGIRDAIWSDFGLDGSQVVEGAHR
jgi:beta-ureidopropionase